MDVDVDTEKHNKRVDEVAILFNEAFEQFMQTADQIFAPINDVEGDAILINVLLDYAAAFFAEHYDLKRRPEINSVIIDSMLQNFREKLERAIIVKSEEK